MRVPLTRIVSLLYSRRCILSYVIVTHAATRCYQSLVIQWNQGGRSGGWAFEEQLHALSIVPTTETHQGVVFISWLQLENTFDAMDSGTEDMELADESVAEV